MTSPCQKIPIIVQENVLVKSNEECESRINHDVRISHLWLFWCQRLGIFLLVLFSILPSGGNLLLASLSLRCNAESSLWKILIVCFLFQSEKEKNDIEKKMTSYRYQRMIWVSAGFLVYLLSMAAKFQKKRLHMILTKKVIRTWRKFLNLCSDGLPINKYNVKKYR